MAQTKICPRCGDSYDDAVDFCAKDGTRLVRSGQPTDLIGRVIAERYRIESRIGEGGMGQVYLAEHVRMRRKSAIKIMRPALVHEPDALQRFTREAENASQLSHPNVAAIFDFGESDGVVYLAMEFIDGESLAAILDREAALHPEVAADIIGQAADGLQAAHDAQMLHRDIKPDNIMLGKRADGTFLVKLVDFGIARTIGGGGQKVTQTGYAVGTPQYMSPEQLAGDTLDARSDQYSLALVAFFALTGKQAFPSESTKESLIQRLTSRPQTLQAARVDVAWPDALQDVFNKALSPEPDERYASVVEFAEAFSVTINSMTPTQTTELYRRALDVRAASVVARTPGAAASGLATGSGERLTVSRSGNTETVSRSGSASAVSPVVPPPPAARWPFVIGGVMVVSVAATLYLVNRTGAASDRGATSTLATADSAIASRVPVNGTGGVSAGGNGGRADSATAKAAANAAAGTDASRGAVAGAGAASLGVASAAPSDAASASAKKLKSDSIKASAKRAKAVADSVAELAAARARYPEAPARAMIGRGIDAKAHIVKGDDIRAVIMPTPMFLWRDEQAQSFRGNKTKADGSRYEIVDPIEQWGAWDRLVAGRRAVYVLEVASERAPWPTLDPARVVDFKRGDIASVSLQRDGVAVPLEFAGQLPAVADAANQQAGGKPMFNSFVAAIAPAAFVPRDDGTMPKIELLVRDLTRNGSETRLTLSEGLVKRLYNEFAPWRDALAR